MIVFVTDENHMYTHKLLLNFDYLKENILVTNYHEIDSSKLNQGDIVVLCDIDRYNQDQLYIPVKLYDELKTKGIKVYNNPESVLRRYDLLKALKKTKHNPQNVWRLSEVVEKKSEIQFPVFVREEYDHLLPGSLINSEEALIDVTKKWYENDMIICEYVNTALDNGNGFHKYGAYYIGGVIVPRHIFVSDNWIVKGNKILSNLEMEMELSYLKYNPHEKQLLEIFKVAKIDYGRIDYAIVDGSVVTFEINTNPTVVDQNDLKDLKRIDSLNHFLKRYLVAFN